MKPASSASLRIRADDGAEFSAYRAQAATPDAPTVLLIQEIFGVNAGMRRLCDAFAAAGFHAVCPDLFHRFEPGIELSDREPADLERAFALYNDFDVERGVRDLAAAAEQTGAKASVGYCMGGFLAYLTACRLPLRAAVCYYGIGIDGVDETPKCPTLLHFADHDPFVPDAVREALVARFSSVPGIDIHTYPNTQHAFARIDGVHRDEAAAQAADARTFGFLHKALQA